jgi:hypothetical protein
MIDVPARTHTDPVGAEYAVACVWCGQVHRAKDERRDLNGKVVQ